MKLTKIKLLTASLLSLFLMGQTATAGDAPRDQAISGNSAAEQYQYPAAKTDHLPRVNYSVLKSDLDEEVEWTKLFPESEH